MSAFIMYSVINYKINFNILFVRSTSHFILCHGTKAINQRYFKLGEYNM